MNPLRTRTRAPLLVERLEDRCLPATLGTPLPDPPHLPLSFVPNGTQAGGQVGTSFRTPDRTMPAAVRQGDIAPASQTRAAVAVAEDRNHPVPATTPADASGTCTVQIPNAAPDTTYRFTVCAAGGKGGDYSLCVAFGTRPVSDPTLAAGALSQPAQQVRLPALTFRLKGAVARAPIGPQPTDTTTAPADATRSSSQPSNPGKTPDPPDPKLPEPTTLDDPPDIAAVVPPPRGQALTCKVRLLLPVVKALLGSPHLPQ
jgi:hypothetical protein